MPILMHAYNKALPVPRRGILGIFILFFGEKAG
jgi:hypothetical protein